MLIAMTTVTHGENSGGRSSEGGEILINLESIHQRILLQGGSYIYIYSFQTQPFICID